MAGKVTLTAAELADLLAPKSFTAGNLGIAGAVHGLTPFNLLGQGPSMSKEQARYRKADSPGRSCADCVMFVPGNRCTLVQGYIAPGAVCDHWEPESAGKLAGDPSLRVTYVPGESCPPSGVKASTPAEPYVAGLMVRAADTGRVLMLQRSLEDEDDTAAGLWENPGGHAEPGETLLMAALREWAEETGMTVPRGQVTGSWDSADGIYRGFVFTVPSEDSVPMFDGRDQVWDPDDPKGDRTQAIAWWIPGQFKGNPSIRSEMARDLPRVMAALKDGEGGWSGMKGSKRIKLTASELAGMLKSAETPVVSTVHHPLGHEGLWHTPSKKVPEMQQLPARP